MNRQVFGLVACLMLWALPLVADKPNVIIFFIDDLGCRDLGCYESDFYETPRIDKLAADGLRFTQFYSAHPVCSPTRAAWMSGKAPQRLGITQWISQPSDIHLPHEETTIAEAFQEAGYETGYIGKWHLGEKDNQLPDSHGFSWMRGVNRAGQPGSYFHPFKRKGRKGVSYWDVPDLESSQPGDYLTDELTDQAIEFITQKREKPFFLCFAHYAVHTPIQSPKPLVEKYKTKKKTQFGDDPRAESKNERNGAKSRTRQDDPAFAAMVENLDMNVGRVLDALESSDLKNTIVVFTSDNGGLTTLKNRVGPTSVHPFRAGKGWCYEGGVRVPTVFYWPGHLSPGTVDTPAITMDLYPTLLELVGEQQKKEQHLDGVSLVPVLSRSGERSLDERVIAWHYPHNHGSGHTPSSAIREGDWKLVFRSDSNKFELYDLANDPQESQDLAEVEQARAQTMLRKLKDWLSETTKENKNR